MRAVRVPTLPALLAAALGCALLGGCGGKDAGDAATAAKPVAISVAPVVKESVPFERQAVGSVEAFATVAVKARVNGRIESIGFEEGKPVRRGDVLFRLDARPFAAALRQAEANAARDAAARDQAVARDERYTALLAKHFVARDLQTEVHAQALALAAAARASAAALEIARLELEYCTITAPIDGIAGRALLQVGNEVKANDDAPLLVINQVQPIRVGFTLPEERLDEVREHQRKGALETRVISRETGAALATGQLEFIDNAVDRRTGTIRLRARFDNADLALWPGRFVTVSLLLYRQDDALLVPSRAVQTGQAGRFVYVLRADQTVEARPVEVSREIGDRSVIASGLAAGESVATHGMLRLLPGAKVEVITGEDTK